MSWSNCWLITFEWRNLGCGSAQWKRENARYVGCVALWFKNYCESSADDVRLIGAVPISDEGFDALGGGGYDHGLTGEET